MIEGQIRIPADVFDLARFREWAHSPEFPERGRISYIGGEIEVDMSPEEIESHSRVKTRLIGALDRWISRGNLGDLLSDGVLYVNDEAGIANEPDLLFSRWESLRSGLVRLGERVKGSERYVEVLGSPDLVIEIVSKGSVRKDKVQLRQGYFAAGVGEYWIVDAREAVRSACEVEFELLTRGVEGFVSRDRDASGYLRSDALGASCRIVRETNPVGGAAFRVLIRQ